MARQFGTRNVAPDSRQIRVIQRQAGMRTTSVLDYYDQLVTLHHGGRALVTDHFRGAAVEPTWTWAAAPFVTPTVAVDLSILTCSFAAANRGFLYQRALSTDNKKASVALWAITVGFAAGLRLDDGTDNNYAEVVMRVSQASPTQWTLQARYRAGGGAVATATGDAISEPDLYVLEMNMLGARWGAWGFYPILRGTHGGLMWKPATDLAALGAAWTPTRAGLVFDALAWTGAYERARVDWCNLDTTV